MAGHSKWANTKYRKSAQDVKRGKIFTKIIRELVHAAKLGGSDISSNPRLRAAVDKALLNNMARVTMNRAIARGVGDDEHDIKMEKVIYEGYGPGGTAVLVECLSDNRNRTAAAVRHAFSKLGGHLGPEGSVSYLFPLTGVISLPPGLNEDNIIQAVSDTKANDIIIHDNGMIDIYCPPSVLHLVRSALERYGYIPVSSLLSRIPSNRADLNEEDTRNVLMLIEYLEDFDEVQEVYHNGNISYNKN